MADSVRHRRKQAQDRTGRWLIIGALVVLCALVTLYVVVRQQQVNLNEETLCPAAGPQALTVILFDRTDPLTTVQREDLRKHLDDIKNKIGRYQGIALYSIGPIGEELLRPEAKLLCNPGRGKDINQAFGNPRLVEQKWRERYAAPLDRLFNGLVQSGEASTSPIMESIQSVAIAALREARVMGIPRRLVIVSDLLQHTPEYSQYNKIMPFEMFRGSSYYRRVRTDLSDVEVELFYVRREMRHHVQGKTHIEFWQQYLADRGGVITRVIALEG